MCGSKKGGKTGVFAGGPKVGGKEKEVELRCTDAIIIYCLVGVFL